MAYVYPDYDRDLSPGEGVSSQYIKERVALMTRVLAKGGILPFVFGHCSSRVPGGNKIYLLSHVHWAGKVLQEVTADDVHTMDLDGNVLDCDSIDLPEERQFHAEVYKARPDIGGLVYGHPNMSCAFAAAGRDTLTVFGTKVPIIPEPGWGSAADKGRKVAGALGKGLAVVWSNSNVVVGRSIDEACVTAFALEWEAERQYFVTQLGGKPGDETHTSPFRDLPALFTKFGRAFFEATDEGPRREVDRKLFWHSGW